MEIKFAVYLAKYSRYAAHQEPNETTRVPGKSCQEIEFTKGYLFQKPNTPKIEHYTILFYPRLRNK